MITDEQLQAIEKRRTELNMPGCFAQPLWSEVETLQQALRERDATIAELRESLAAARNESAEYGRENAELRKPVAERERQLDAGGDMTECECRIVQPQHHEHCDTLDPIIKGKPCNCPQPAIVAVDHEGKAFHELDPEDRAALKLCDDCPPAGYPTDKTRCRTCPLRKESGNG